MRGPTPKDGDEITPKIFQVLYDAIDEGVHVVPPLAKNSDGSIYLADQPGFWIQMTGSPSGTKHPWKQVIAQTGGTWTDGAFSGTTTDDPAYEINGSTDALTGKRARAWRDKTSGEVRFAYGACT